MPDMPAKEIALSTSQTHVPCHPVDTALIIDIVDAFGVFYLSG